MSFLVCLVTFERTQVATDVSSDDCQGAVGYMAVDTVDEDEARDIFHSALSEVGLSLIEIDIHRVFESADDLNDLDEHLAQNVRNWEYGKRTVWGTIHGYYADGHA